MSIRASRTNIVLRPDPSRVFFRPFDLMSQERITRIVARVRDIVKCCVSERGASLLNDWLGGLLGLFFAIDELNADDDLGDEFKALESTPMLLGFQGEFKDHRQGRDP